MKNTIAFILLLQLTLLPAYAQEDNLRVSPKTCVALKKGKVCYQSIRIRFSAASADDYCLISSESIEPLQCWSGKSDMEMVYRFASDKDIDFTIIDKNKQTVANARVTLVWVYKQTRKKNRWRLF